MTHDSYRELIQRELDDDLSSEELALLEAHVATCAHCRQEREEFQSLALGLSHLTKLLPERSLLPQVTPEILSEPQKKQAARRIAPIWWRGLSVAAVVVLAIGWSTQWKFGQAAHVAGPQPTKSGTIQTALLPASPPVQTQAVVQDQQLAASGSTTNGTVDSKSPAPVQAPSVLQNVANALKQSLLGTPQPATPSPGTRSQPSHPTLLADASNGLSTQPSQPGNSQLVTINPVSQDNGSGQGGNSDSNAGGTGSSDPGAVTGSNSGTTPAPTPAPTPGVTGPTYSDGGGLKPSLTGGQSTPAVGENVSSISAMLTGELQRQADNGVATAQWALDPVQVVKRSLPALGFTRDADVTQTDSPDRVHVEQRGVQYEITLVQPFEQGATGIWMPEAVGQAINEQHPNSLYKPIILYLNSLTASGQISDHQTIYVQRGSTSNHLTVSVDEQVMGDDGSLQWVHVKFVFKLKQAANKSWVLDGNPTQI